MKFVMVCAAAVLLAAGGCSKPPEDEGVASAGGGVTAGQSADPTRPADNPQDRILQFVACMRANGVDVPDPDPGDAVGKSAMRFDDNGADKQKVAGAMQKCGHYLPSGGEGFIQTPEQIEATRRFAQCMRENGQPNFPDPLPDGSFDGDQMAGISKDDPAVRAVMDRCRGTEGKK